MDQLFAVKLAIFALFIASVLFVHFRGRVRLSFRRQLTDHSTFLAPWNTIVYLSSAVPTTPMLEARDFPELAPLRDNWRTIRDEAVALRDQGFIRASPRHDDLGFNTFFRKGWKRFYLKWYGDELPSAERLCPRTVELIRSIPTVHGALFALMSAGGRVSEHRDPFAGSLRYHLGLATPNSDQCRLFVDGIPYSWRDGEDLVFDETYVHRFENLTAEDRIILFCDVERPIRNPLVRAVNRWAIRNVVRFTASRNTDDEEVGLANRVFGTAYEWRVPFRRIKKANRTLYYALKYGVIAAVIYVLIAPW